MPKKSALKMGWRINQSSKKQKKKTKLAVSILILIFVLILLGQIVNFAKIVTGPWNKDKSGKDYQWDERFNINLVIKAKSIAFLSLDPGRRQVVSFSLPGNTFTDVPGGFGKWQISSVYNLGGSQAEGRELLKQTVSAFLGSPVDGLLEFRGSLADDNPADLIQKYSRNVFSGLGDINNIQTDLTPLELIRLKTYLSKVRFDKIINIDLEKLGVLQPDKLNDGTDVFIAEEAKVDTALVDLFDPAIKNEHMTIAVLNATDHPQLAQRAARLINNLGGNVIITANAEKAYSKTQVTGRMSATYKRLSQIFDLDCSKDPKCDKICDNDMPQSNRTCVTDPDIEISRAQIKVVLGEDFFIRQ